SHTQEIERESPGRWDQAHHHKEIKHEPGVPAQAKAGFDDDFLPDHRPQADLRQEAALTRSLFPWHVAEADLANGKNGPEDAGQGRHAMPEQVVTQQAADETG